MSRVARRTTPRSFPAVLPTRGRKERKRPDYREVEQYATDLVGIVEVLEDEARDQGLSRNAWAAKAGLSPGTVYRLLAGDTRFPWASTLWKLSASLGKGVGVTAGGGFYLDFTESEK